MPAAPSPPLSIAGWSDARVDAPVVVALSGGLDSTVLLHLLASQPTVRAHGLRALHVHHGLQAHADAWVEHCAQACAGLGIELAVRHVEVQPQGDGPEAAARRARRSAFAGELEAGEVLALAHHRDDQAETFLLRALRASGPDGLAAMRPWLAFARGWLWRPLLDMPRAALLAHAQAHGLRWIEDPSNADDALDRNFLRHRVLPLLRERWPQADAALARSAALQAQAAALLDEGDAGALASAGSDCDATLSITALLALPASRRARVLRAWIARRGLPPLPANGVARIERELLHARPDAAACFAWAGACVRCWRGLLHAQAAHAPLPADWSAQWDGTTALELPGGGRLRLEPAAGATHGAPCDAATAPRQPRNDPALAATPDDPPTNVATPRTPNDPPDDAGRAAPPWRAHPRHGGERIALPGRAHSHALKHVLQDAGIPPWERACMPLLTARDGTLLAAGDGVLSGAFAAWLHARGLRLRWQRPAAADDTPAAPLR